MLLTILLIAWSKKVNFVLILWKKHFNKELAVTKDDEDFENSLKSWICGHAYVESDAKVRDHFHVTGKYRGSAHRDCSINVKWNHKIPIVFHKIKNYDTHLNMQELGKCNFKIKVLSNGLEKYLSFNTNNELIFIDCFQFLRFSLDSLVKTEAVTRSVL